MNIPQLYVFADEVIDEIGWGPMSLIGTLRQTP
jgi:hypothetical protein